MMMMILGRGGEMPDKSCARARKTRPVSRDGVAVTWERDGETVKFANKRNRYCLVLGTRQGYVVGWLCCKHLTHVKRCLIRFLIRLKL